MKFAAHTNQMTMTRDYLSSITVVDGLGGFLKLPLRSDQAEDFRCMTAKRNPELFLSLPTKTQDELRQREDYVAITKRLEDLSLETNTETQTALRNQLLKQRRMLDGAYQEAQLDSLSEGSTIRFLLRLLWALLNTFHSNDCTRRRQ
jgi:hypothetical protein